MLTHENDKTVVCPIVGDGMVGKTQICKTFAGSQTADDYTATVSDLYTVPTYMMGSDYIIKIVDSSGQVSVYNKLVYLIGRWALLTMRYGLCSLVQAIL